jgi:hypothetical protein
MFLKPKTWGVWWRYRNAEDRLLSGWSDRPKQYSSEKAARMAVLDLNKEFTWDHGRCEHVALQLDSDPNKVFPDE